MVQYYWTSVCLYSPYLSSSLYLYIVLRLQTIKHGEAVPLILLLCYSPWRKRLWVSVFSISVISLYRFKLRNNFDPSSFAINVCFSFLPSFFLLLFFPSSFLLLFLSHVISPIMIISQNIVLVLVIVLFLVLVLVPVPLFSPISVFLHLSICGFVLCITRGGKKLERVFFSLRPCFLSIFNYVYNYTCAYISIKIYI